VFPLAVGLGAFLLFFVQPLVAKMVLPWFGGGTAVWSTCLMFFQVGLVAGYGYAHLTRRLGATRQVWLHLALLAAALLVLPIAPDAALKPPDGTRLVPRVLSLLTLTVGLPFVLLAATAPLLQDWFARLHPARSPYPLYVVSNVGALAALLCYPTLVEPGMPTGRQSIAWSVLFGAFVLAVGACGLRVTRHARGGALVSQDAGPTEARAQGAAAASAAAPDGLSRALWVALPATGTALLVSTTSQLTQDIAAVPLLWVVPLALYLVTYILGFAGWYHRRICGLVMVIAIGVSLASLLAPAPWPLRAQVTWLMAALFAACLVCHGELSRLRPGAAHLTGFYLLLSIGGAAGGTFMAIGAPALFDRYVELPLALLAACGLLGVVVARDGSAARLRTAGVAGAALAFGLGIGILVRDTRSSDEIARHRNVYGMLRVRQEPATDSLAMRFLYHGRVLHGAQFLDPDRELTPTTYYGTSTGVGWAIARHPKRVDGMPLRIGAIGLGAGTLAAYGRAGDAITFYEIDPAVLDMARAHFTFLDKSSADVRIVMGDARLSLERDLASGPPPRFDVLVVDAFSGDAIPVHLLTRESFALYRQALSADGIMAIHVSNQYLDLQPVVHGLADEHGMAVVVISLGAVPAFRAPGSTWMLVTSNARFMAETPNMPATTVPDDRHIVWTDDFSSLMSVLR
jgi:spermidine synthase